MKRLTVRTGLAWAALPVLLFAATASAATTATVSDAAGDTIPLPGVGSTPAYLDIVGGVVAKQGRKFNLTIQLAESVPARPALPGGTSELWWFMAFDTDPTAFPNGFPRAPGEGQSFPSEYTAVVSWDGTRFSAFVVDRRPSLVGGDAVSTPTTFSIGTRLVSLTVDETLLGNPASFGFRAYTRAWHSMPGTEGFTFTDFAPDDFAIWVPWAS